MICLSLGSSVPQVMICLSLSSSVPHPFRSLIAKWVGNHNPHPTVRPNREPTHSRAVFLRAAQPGSPATGPCRWGGERSRRIRGCSCRCSFSPHHGQWVPQVRRVFVFAPNLGMRPVRVCPSLSSSVPHLCAKPFGARVGNHEPKSEAHPHHKTRVPQVRRVFVFAPNLGQLEPTPDSLGVLR
jgi:hypothetical protein